MLARLITWLDAQLLAAQLKQKIGRLTQRVVDESLHMLERISGVRLLAELAELEDSIEPLDQINQATIGENVVHDSKGAARRRRRDEFTLRRSRARVRRAVAP